MDLTGKSLGKYTLLEKLGHGGMAEVYKARQALIERLVAVKVMLPELAHSEEFVQRFHREAQRLGALRHPNIVSVLDFDILDGVNFLVMDYVSGPTLRKYLNTRRRLSLHETLIITRQILEALQYAHEKGVIHCDLNPGNVMFLDQSCRQVVLTDFGLARLLDVSGKAHTTTLIGTPAYMSPEALESKPLDGRSDLYSLGVMLYEILTGEQPFTGDTTVAVIVKHLQEPPPDLRKKRPDLPDTMAYLFQRAMRKNPEERFSSAAEMLQAVNSILNNFSKPDQPTLISAPVDLSRSMSSANAQVKPASSPAIKRDEHRQDISSVHVPISHPSTRADQAAKPVKRRLPGWGIALIFSIILILAMLIGSATIIFIARQASQLRASPTLPAAALLQTSTPASTNTPAAGQSASSPTPPEPVEPALPPIEAGRYGELTVVLDNQGKPSNLLAVLHSIPLPPNGSGYVAWLGNETQFYRLGQLAVQDGRAHLFQPVDPAIIGQMTQARITLESDPLNATTPGDSVVYSAAFSPERQDAYRQLVQSSREPTRKPYLQGILEQTLQAADHQAFMLNAVLDGRSANGVNPASLQEARAHAEHSVNILEGKNGATFGDLDGDGQIQNPGDDVGVRYYIENSIPYMLSAAQAEPQTALRQAQFNELLANYQNALLSIQDLIQINQEFIASTDSQRQLELALLANSRMQNLLNGESGLGGLWGANQEVLQLVNLPLIGGEFSRDLSPLTGPPPAAVIQVDDQNGFTLLINTLPAAPASYRYALWGMRLSDDGYDLIGLLDPSSLNFNGSFVQDPLSAYKDILLSLESSAQTPTAPTRVVLHTPVNPMPYSFLTTLTNQDESGVLDKAQNQARMALDHAQFLTQSLEKGDLADAKRHAEHVVNILQGVSGPRYGDIDGDGNLQNPGDDIGVLGYLSQIDNQTTSLISETLSGSQLERLSALTRGIGATETLIDQCYEAANKVIASDTISEAKNNAPRLIQLAQAVLDGFDTNNDGVIDPNRGEAGLSTIYTLAASLRYFVLIP